MSATPIVRGPPAATPRPASTSSDALDFRSKVMKKIATWTVLACATSLAGCTGAAYSNRSLESVHQPVVRNNLYQFDVATADGELPPSEQGRLQGRSEEHTSELQSLMRNSYAVFCLKKKK